MTPLLMCENLNFVYPGTQQKAICDLNLSITLGEWVSLLGENGSGKSTLFKMLTRQCAPNKGTIFLRGRPIESYSLAEFSRRVVLLTQNSAASLFDHLTVFENMLVREYSHQHGISLWGRSKLSQEFQEFLAGFHPHLAERFHLPVHLLSGGEKQLLLLALIMRKPPDLLLLDEHASALDPAAMLRMMQLTSSFIKKHHVTCLMISHHMEHALSFADRAMVLKNGSLHVYKD